jgi:hypothetical protein
MLAYEGMRAGSGAQRVEVRDAVPAGRRHDYADAFAVDLPAPDDTPPATWLGAALSRTPPLVDWVASRLGFSTETREPLDGWEVEMSTSDAIHLVVELPLMHVDFVGRNESPTRRTLTTHVIFRRPWLARPVWLVVGPAHRRTARWLLDQTRRRKA